jgi:hypothetical protein
MSDGPTLPPPVPDFGRTPAEELLDRYGSTWQISRETLHVFVAVKRTGTATWIVAGTPDEVIAAIERAEAEE